jgi:N-methylhydantoinase B
LPGKCSLRAKAGSVLRMETPGGGGWGPREA